LIEFVEMRRFNIRPTSLVTVAFAIVFGLFHHSAFAGHDTKRTLDFLGFSSDGNKYLLLVHDDNVGDFISVRSFRTGKQVKGIPILDPGDRNSLVDKARGTYRITDPGAESLSSPDGLYTFVGFPKGRRFHLRVMRGERSAGFHTMEVESGPSGPAGLTLKTVHWSRDGHRIVVVVHKRLFGENGVDSERAMPFRFLSGGLKFR